jgi:hypothetical protein
LCCRCVILFYLGFVLVTFVWSLLKMPLYYVSLSFVLSLCCTKDGIWNSVCMGTREFPSVPNVITQHMLGSWVSDVTFVLFINTLNAKLNPICHLLPLLGAHHILHVSRIKVNIMSIPHLPEHQTTLHIWWSHFTLFSLALCVAIWWPCIFNRMNYGGVGVWHFYKQYRCSTTQCLCCPVLCCDDRPSQCPYTHIPLYLRDLYSSSSSYICHGIGPLVDPFRSHVSRSHFKVLPWFLLPVGE